MFFINNGKTGLLEVTLSPKIYKRAENFLAWRPSRS